MGLGVAGRKLAGVGDLSAASREGLSKFVRGSAIRIIYKTNFVVIYVFMTTISLNARALAALGHDARLSIFRLLVKAGDAGLRVSDIGENLGLPASTLAHHLSTLVDAGLVLQDKQGREVFNRVDYPAMHRVVGFLTSECCSGVSVQPAADAA